MSGEINPVNDEEVIEDTDQEGDFDFDNMSDEDFLNSAPSTTASGADSDHAQKDQEEEDDSAAGDTKESDEDLTNTPEDPAEDAAKPEEGGEQPTDEEAVAADDGEGKTTAQHSKPKEGAGNGAEGAADTPSSDGSAAADEQPDYEALYKKMMAPFKANGKQFVPTSPEEVIRLAQMGANYTRKMQGLQPNLKLMRMLENNGLLDEEKLSFLIDIDKKNPKAVQKLLKDANIDPLDLDVSAESDYKPGNHSVSDKEMQFHEVLQEVASTEHGKGTISHIHNNWDQVSKDAIYEDPKLLSIITEQRSNGIYDVIASEIDRQRTLGNLTGMPFLQAYKTVGDRLNSEGRFANLGASGTEVQTNTQIQRPRQIIETRPAISRKPVTNNDKAKAASPVRRTPANRSPKEFDPFSMTDEQIMAISSVPRI